MDPISSVGMSAALDVPPPHTLPPASASLATTHPHPTHWRDSYPTPYHPTSYVPYSHAPLSPSAPFFTAAPAPPPFLPQQGFQAAPWKPNGGNPAVASTPHTTAITTPPPTLAEEALAASSGPVSQEMPAMPSSPTLAPLPCLQPSCASGPVTTNVTAVVSEAAQTNGTFSQSAPEQFEFYYAVPPPSAGARAPIVPQPGVAQPFVHITSPYAAAKPSASTAKRPRERSAKRSKTTTTQDDVVTTTTTTTPPPCPSATHTNIAAKSSPVAETGAPSTHSAAYAPSDDEPCVASSETHKSDRAQQEMEEETAVVVAPDERTAMKQEMDEEEEEKEEEEEEGEESNDEEEDSSGDDSDVSESPEAKMLRESDTTGLVCVGREPRARETGAVAAMRVEDFATATALLTAGEHPLIPGLFFFPDFITEAEEAEYLAFVDRDEPTLTSADGKSSLVKDAGTLASAAHTESEGLRRTRRITPRHNLLDGTSASADTNEKGVTIVRGWRASDVYQAQGGSSLASARLVRDWGPTVLRTSGMTCARVTERLPDLPYFCAPLQRRIARAVRSHDSSIPLDHFKFVYMQCNKYVQADGHWVDYHVDEISKFGSVIAIVTLGSAGVVRMRRKNKRLREPDEPYEVPVGRRSLYVMTGECRYFWEHAVPQFGTPENARISLVLRTVTDVNRTQNKTGGASSPASPSARKRTRKRRR